MGFYKGDWRPSSSKRGRWKENKTDGGGEPNHHYSNLACSFSWHSDEKKKKEQVTLPLEDCYLIIEKDNTTEKTVQWFTVKNTHWWAFFFFLTTVHNSCSCPVQHKMQLLLHLRLSVALSKQLFHFFGDGTAINMYKLYILEMSGQYSPSPPTFFTLHLDRERLKRGTNVDRGRMDVNMRRVYNRALWDQGNNIYHKSAYGLKGKQWH